MKLIKVIKHFLEESSKIIVSKNVQKPLKTKEFDREKHLTNIVKISTIQGAILKY